MSNDWEKVSINPTHDFESNKEFVGIYLGSRDEVGPNKSKLYDFRQPDGSTISVWGNSALDNKLKNINLNDEVKIVYLGFAKSEKTGRQYRNFEVYHRAP